jgi:CDP-glycerol glycerophosphotransferase (TagB/SpsB family)
MVAHNLTGLKGTKFYTSAADLNVVPGMRNTFRMAESGRSYVLGGYPKWDKIYPMRFKVDEIRERLRKEYDFPAERKIVAFYPTQSLYHKPGLYQAMGFYDRCRKELGPTEFFVCLHHNFVRSPRKSYDLDFLRSWESAHESVHVVDGADALPIITACHLFVTDTCSTVVTALSMKKPVLFIEMELEGPAPEPAGVYLRQIDIFQSYGVMAGEVDDLDHFIKHGHPRDRTEELFQSCVAYDDDRNCERIVEIVGEQYRLWQKSRGRG